jgi:hypothetical protein
MQIGLATHFLDTTNTIDEDGNVPNLRHANPDQRGPGIVAADG